MRINQRSDQEIVVVKTTLTIHKDNNSMVTYPQHSYWSRVQENLC